jgi:hypothetical protein
MGLWLAASLPALILVLSFIRFSFPRSNRMEFCPPVVAIISDQDLVPRERHPRLGSRAQNCNYRPLAEAARVTTAAVSAACAAILPAAKEEAAVRTVTLWLGLILPARILVFSFIPSSSGLPLIPCWEVFPQPAFCPLSLTAQCRRQNQSSLLKNIFWLRGEALSSRFFNYFQYPSERGTENFRGARSPIPNRGASAHVAV